MCSGSVPAEEPAGSDAGAREAESQCDRLTVTKQDGACVVMRGDSEEPLFSSPDPRRAIEWALDHGRIVTELAEFPGSLPVMLMTVRVIGNAEKEPVTVLERTYRLELDGTPTATVVR
jgi:hypothetical protein